MSVPVTPIIEAIEAKDPQTAAALAIQLQPALLVEAFDYHRIVDDAEPYLEFVRVWIAVAHPLDKPIIAGWFLNNSVADFAYLSAQAEAVALLTSSVRAAKEHLAGLLDELEVVSEGPDAGLTKAQVVMYKNTAIQLRELSIP